MWRVKVKYGGDLGHGEKLPVGELVLIQNRDAYEEALKATEGTIKQTTACLRRRRKRRQRERARRRMP